MQSISYIYILYNIIFSMKRRSFKFVLFSVKENLLSIIFVLFTISLVIFSNSNLSAAKTGLSLWANSVVPSLFPFFIATELLSYTNVISMLGTRLNFLMRPLFNVPGEGSFPFIMGIISGYPTGAKIVSKFKNDGICTSTEAERLLAFTNNSGPLFIIGTVGISLFGSIEIGVLLLLTHILACITVGILFRFWKYNKSHTSSSKYVSKASSSSSANISSLGKILGASITSATRTVVLIGGFVVLFSVIISIVNSSGILDLLCKIINPFLKTLNIDSRFSSGIISGIIELTNGVSIISSISVKAISINVIFCAFLLGFGGISVVLQVFSIVSEAGISIKPYIFGKFLQGIFAALYTFLLINNFQIFNLDLF